MVMGINSGQKKMKELVYRLVRFFPVFLLSGETKNQKERSAAVRFFFVFLATERQKSKLTITPHHTPPHKEK